MKTVILPVFVAVCPTQQGSSEFACRFCLRVKLLVDSRRSKEIL
jgi:hypothetical protein